MIKDYISQIDVTAHTKGIEQALATSTDQHAFSSFSDAWKKIRKPQKRVLVDNFKRSAYTCAELNATGVAATPIRLFVSTNKNQRRTRWPTQPIFTKVFTSASHSAKLKRVDL